MLPNSRRKRFVPPMKGSQTNDNDSISSSQISQTQSSCCSLNNITFFSESLKTTNTDNVLLSMIVNNDTTLVENSDKMDDSLELLHDNNTEVSCLLVLYRYYMLHSYTVLH